ncbi:hypothetical protein [Sulfurimonas sp. HSL-1716]|uniref:hypothetical protein n=1 Tax=Hydrocurvibacter sulfurireducens TaxID=3131937 RepID=UPI0031F986C1
MKILSSQLYEEQLKAILDSYFGSDIQAAKSFKLYLDTIIINMPTKVKKYKQSIYFDDENIKDIENQGFTIPFFIDNINNTYIILGIVDNKNYN